MAAPRRLPARPLLLVLWAIAAVLLVLVVVGAARGDVPHRVRGCTHGVSSIGPVAVVDGKVVGGSARPHTQACLP